MSNKDIKWNVDVISSEILILIDYYFRFTTVPLDPFFIQNGDILIFLPEIGCKETQI